MSGSLKEFENWYKREVLPRIPENSGIPDDFKDARRDAWRAALEWSQNIDKGVTKEYTDSQYGAIKQSIAIDVELRGD